MYDITTAKKRLNPDTSTGDAALSTVPTNSGVNTSSFGISSPRNNWISILLVFFAVNCLPFVALSELSPFRYIRKIGVMVGTCLFGSNLPTGAAALFLSLSLSIIGLLFVLTISKISAAVASGRPEKEREVIETYVLASGLISGSIAGAMVFLIEYGKHASGGAEARTSPIVVLGLSATVGILVALFVFVGSIVFAFDRQIGHNIQKLQAGVIGIETGTKAAHQAAGTVKDGTDELRKVTKQAIDLWAVIQGIDPESYSKLGEELLLPYKEYMTAMATWTDGASVREMPVAIITSYLYEEAFDLRRRHVVTNPRNYTAFLIDTVFELTRMAQRQDKILEVNIVTPVTPVYLMNWPQRLLVDQSPVRGNFILPFLHEFYMFSHELLVSSWSKHLSLRRWLLVADDASRQPHGCELAARGENQYNTHMREIFVLPVPVTISCLVKCKLSTEALKRVVECSCRDWYTNADRDSPSVYSELDKYPDLPFYSMFHTRDLTVLKSLLTVGREAIVQHWRDRFNEKLEEIKVIANVSGDADLCTEETNFIEGALQSLDTHNPPQSKPEDMREFHRSLQRLTLCLTKQISQKKIPGSKAVDDFHDAILMYRHALLWRAGSFDPPDKPQDPNSYSVKNVFAKAFHSPVTAGDGYCQYAKVVKEGNCPHPNEFVLCGVRDTKGKSDWMAAVTATVHHPWRSAQVNVETDVDTWHFREVQQAFETTLNLADLQSNEQ